MIRNIILGIALLSTTCGTARADMCVDPFRVDAEGHNTAEMIEDADRSLKLADQRLNEVYQELIQRQRSAGRWAGRTTDRVEALRDAQRFWIRFRDSNCDWEADSEGSAAPVERLLCHARMTRIRTCELRSRNKEAVDLGYGKPSESSTAPRTAPETVTRVPTTNRDRSAAAPTPAQQAVLQFDAFCVRNRFDLGHLAVIAKTLGYKVMPNEFAALGKAPDSTVTNVWGLEKGGVVHLLALANADDGSGARACTFVTRGLNAHEIDGEIVKILGAANEFRQRDGAQEFASYGLQLLDEKYVVLHSYGAVDALRNMSNITIVIEGPAGHR